MSPPRVVPVKNAESAPTPDHPLVLALKRQGIALERIRGGWNHIAIVYVRATQTVRL